MGSATTWLHLVPQSLLAAGLFIAALVLYLRGGRTPALNALALLLVFRGHLSLATVVARLADSSLFALHLWPMFEIATIGATLAFIVLLYADLLDERQLDGLLSSIIGGGALLVVLLSFMPDLFWGNGGNGGPLAFLGGLRITFWALLAWILLHRALRARLDDTGIPPRFALLLAVGFLVPAVHWAATDLLYILLLRIQSVGLGATADHRGRLVAGLVVLVVFFLLFRAGRRHAEAHVRYGCRRTLLLGLIPALSSILILNLHLVGLIGSAVVGLVAASLLGSLWTLALPLAVAVGLSRPGPARAPTSVDHGEAAAAPAE